MYKRGVISRLFKNTIAFKSNNFWSEKTIGECLKYEQPQKYIVASENYDDNYRIPVLTANKAFILGYTNEVQGIYNKGDAIIYDDFTMETKYVNFPFKVKSSTIKILTATNENNLYFMYSLLQSLNLKPEGHQRSYISKIESMKVLVPPLFEQDKIAAFLSDIDKKIVLTEQFITNLKKQKSAYLQKMFI